MPGGNGDDLFIFFTCLALLVFGFPVVAFIAFAIIAQSPVPRKTVVQPYVLKRLVDGKVCEYCNTVNVASSYTCIKCKREFGSRSMIHHTVETMDLSPELRAHVNEGKVQICRNCGRLNSPTRTTCKKCNGDLLA